LENINISRSRDVKIGEFKNIDIDNSYYNNEICTSCQKMILTKYNGETEVRTMLRHIRNAIAHGSFAVFNDLLFFKDTKINNNIRCTTAIIKINIIALNLALKLIIDSNGITQDNLISRAFQYLGFEVQRQVLIGKYRPDMIITKDGLKYAIEIKINKIKKIGYNDPLIDREIEALSLFKNEKITPVLIYDQMYASEKAKNRIKNEGIILLDKTEIAKLVEGTFL
jgi:Holliday junction resolvase